MTQVSTPFFSPSTGTYGSDQIVTITSVTPGASIYYTTEGQLPPPPPPPTALPCPLPATELVQAIAVKGNDKILIGGYFTTYNGVVRGPGLVILSRQRP